MSLSSMTGFARYEHSSADRLIIVEMRSVNGRGLDIRFRMPSGFDGIDSQFRALAAERLRRGNIQVSVTLSQPLGQSQSFKINWAFLQSLLNARWRPSSSVEASPVLRCRTVSRSTATSRLQSRNTRRSNSDSDRQVAIKT